MKTADTSCQSFALKFSSNNDEKIVKKKNEWNKKKISSFFGRSGTKMSEMQWAKTNRFDYIYFNFNIFLIGIFIGNEIHLTL